MALKNEGFQRQIWLIGGLEHVLFFHNIWESFPLTHIFQDW
jgi:hypothetical protein